MPDLFIRGAGTYTAHINADNPIGTMQSIEHTLRALDRAAADEQQQLQRLEKTLTDYQAQAQRPFEHEARLKELLARQAQLNAALDLDKSDAQAAEAATEPDIETAAVPCRTESVTPRVQQTPYQPRDPTGTAPSTGQAKLFHPLLRSRYHCMIPLGAIPATRPFRLRKGHTTRVDDPFFRCGFFVAFAHSKYQRHISHLSKTFSQPSKGYTLAEIAGLIEHKTKDRHRMISAVRTLFRNLKPTARPKLASLRLEESLHYKL